MSEKPAPPAHLPALDGLRGLAIATVLVHNLTHIETHASLGQKLWTFVGEVGWVGVQLFFVLSGFLITGILLDDRGKPSYFRTFFVRRALRIFPLYFLFLAGRFLVLPLLVAGTSVPLGSQVWYWLYVSNWHDLLFGALAGMGHFWSLAVEEQFYFSWPFLTARARPRTLFLVCVVVIVGSLAARIGMRVASVPPAWLYASTIARADGLAAGSLVALALRSEEGRARLMKWLRPLTWVSLAGLVGIVGTTHGLSRLNWEVQTFGYSLLAILFAVVIAVVALPSPPRWSRWLSVPALRKLGKYSYATYVFHSPLNVVATYFLGARLAAWTSASPALTDVAFVLVVSIASFALAVVSYVALEKPMLSFKDRLAPR